MISRLESGSLRANSMSEYFDSVSIALGSALMRSKESRVGLKSFWENDGRVWRFSAKGSLWLVFQNNLFRRKFGTGLFIS